MKKKKIEHNYHSAEVYNHMRKLKKPRARKKSPDEYYSSPDYMELLIFILALSLFFVSLSLGIL